MISGKVIQHDLAYTRGALRTKNMDWKKE